MAWTTKSIDGQRLASAANIASSERGIVGVRRQADVAGQHEIGAERLGQRHDALAERRRLVGEGKLGAVLGEALGDAPGDGMVVGDPHHQAALAAHQAGGHWRPFPPLPGRYSAVIALQNQRRVGAAEPEGVRKRGIDLDVVHALANDRHVGEVGIEFVDVRGLGR